jgi:ribosomal protein L30E
MFTSLGCDKSSKITQLGKGPTQDWAVQTVSEMKKDIYRYDRLQDLPVIVFGYNAYQVSRQHLPMQIT